MGEGDITSTGNPVAKWTIDRPSESVTCTAPLPPNATQCHMMHNLITRALARDARHLLLKAQCSLQRLISKHVQGYRSKQKTYIQS